MKNSSQTAPSTTHCDNPHCIDYARRIVPQQAKDGGWDCGSCGIRVWAPGTPAWRRN